MGRGDIKSKKGKIAKGTYGKSRKRKTATVMAAPKKKVAKKAAPKKAAAPKKEAAPKVEAVVSGKMTEAELKKMTVADLKALATKNNIELPAKALKGDLVKLLS